MMRGIKRAGLREFSLSCWEWAFLVAVGLLVTFIAFNEFLPQWVVNGLAGLIFGSAAVGLVGYFLVLPAIALLVGAVVAAAFVVFFCIRLLVGVLNFLGAAWRGEIRP